MISVVMGRRSVVMSRRSRSDVQSLRSGCEIGLPQQAPQTVDLTEEPDPESDWQGDLSELQAIVNRHLFSEELDELNSLVRSHLE
jgi:hypothetical protein